MKTEGTVDRESGAEWAGMWLLRIGLLVVPLAFFPGLYRAAHFPKLLVLAVVTVGLGVCCLMARRLWLPRCSLFVYLLLVYLALIVVQVLRSINPAQGLLVLASQAGFLLLCLGTACLVRPGREISLLRLSAAAGLLVGLLGVAEHLGVVWVQLPSAGRPSATFGFRNIAAMYLVVNLPLCGVLVFGQARRDWLLGLASTAAMTAFLLYTRTRGAWLGILVAVLSGVGVALCFRDGEGRRWVVVLWQRLGRFRQWGTVLVFVGALGVGWLPGRFLDPSLHRLDEKKSGVGTAVVSLVNSGADRGRLRVWRHTLEMIWEHSFAGVGLGNWPAFYPLYDRGDVLVLASAPQRPHNDFLWIWAELGTVGLLVYLGLLGSVGAGLAWRFLRGNEDERLLVFFMGMGLVAFLVHSAFSFPREQAAPAFLFWMVAGLAGRVQGLPRITGPGLRAASAVGVACALAGAWLFITAGRFDVRFARALVAQEAGRSQLQAVEAEAAMVHGVFDHRVLLLAGDAAFSTERYDDATQVYREYLRYQPYLPAVYNNLGQALEAQGMLTEAEVAYQDGLEIFPEAGGLLDNLAGVYRKQGEMDRARELYEAHRPKTATGFHNLGLIYAEQKNFSGARDAYKEALRLDSNLNEAYYSLGGVYIYLDQYEAAAEALETFLEREPDNHTLVRRAEGRLAEIYPVLGDRAIRQRDLAGAKQAYERLAQLGGGSAEMYNNLANIYRHSGDTEAARASCRKAIGLDPSFAEAYWTYAGILDEAGEWEAAVENYRTFLKYWDQDERFAERARSRISALEGQER